jgi:hypothetical protein
MAKLSTAEKDLAVLQRKNIKLEAELANSIAKLSESDGASQAWESEVVRLRKEHADLTERVDKSEQTCSKLHLAITTLENRASDAKNDFGQLQQALHVSEAEIVKLKDEIKELHQQHQENLHTIHQRDTHIASLRQQIHTKDATLADNDDIIAYQTSQIHALEFKAAASETRVHNLESELQAKEAEATQLQKANDEYASLMSSLHDEIKELRASKAALEQIVRTVKHVEGHSRLPLRQSREENSPYLDQGNDKACYGGSSSVGEMRPMSGETRVGTSHSNRSSKALRTIGIDTRPMTGDKDSRPRLYELWEDERVDVNGGDSPNGSLSRRLTRKKREEQLAREKKEKEHGKLYNLAHFGSLDRPKFIRRAESRAEFHNLRR